MGVDVSSSAIIARPRPEVYAFAADPRNAPLWYSRISEVDWRGGDAVAEGAEAEFLARFLGRELRYTYRIVDLVPRQWLVMRTAAGPFPMETRYDWQDAAPDRTRMTIRNRGHPAGFSRLLTPLMALAMRRAMGQDLAALKRILEAGPPPPSRG